MRNVPPQLPCPCPPEVLTGRRVAALAADLRAGRAGALEAFWAEAAARGTPLVEERFGAAIAQSGSFWWPNEPAGPGERSGSGGERLTAELAAADRVPDRVYVEVGTYEWALLGPTRRLRDTLRAGGCELTYRKYEGGHDHACWRGSLADGLIAAFS